MSDRHQFRAIWHNYGFGVYFVTICSHEMEWLFGTIRDKVFSPTPLGRIIEEHISKIPTYYEDVDVWNSVIMPNHLHLIISIGMNSIYSSMANIQNHRETSSLPAGCLREPKREEAVEDFHHNSRLASAVGSFKAGVTRHARKQGISTLPCWQSRYHEHIILNNPSLDNIMQYIDTNIENWEKDCFYEER